MKKVVVDISVSMSSTRTIEIPEDLDESDSSVLEDAVIEQIYLPQDAMECAEYRDWVVDDLCVVKAY